jgi:two-component system, sensor histidine kinase
MASLSTSTSTLCLAPVPSDEQARLAELYRFDILDTVAEAPFDRITTLAAAIFDAPYSVITLVDRSRHWFKSADGMPRGEISRQEGFCGHTIMTDNPMIVPDATKDPRFVDDPSVTGDAAIRFYAGAPLVMSSGFRIGTLCIMDDTPRTDGFSEREISILEHLAGLVVREIEQRVDVVTETSALSDELKNAQAAKDQFLQMLSHELRTPLNAIIGFSSLIQGEPADAANDKSREYAGDIGRAGDHLLGLIDGILDWTRLERGELEIEENVTPVSALIEQAISRLSAGAGQVTVAPFAADLRLLCDSRCIGQVLAHVLENAIKFSPERAPVTLTAETGGDGGITISVSDTGPGVSTEARQKAFSQFEKFETRPDQFTEGIGLGLAISRKLMDLHGGHIEFVDTPGPGATVALVFPAHQTAA